MGVFVDRVPAVSHGNAEIEALITGRFASSEGYATRAYDDTLGYIGNMMSLLGTLAVPVAPDINVDEPNVPEIVFAERPNLGDLVIPDNWPDLPVAPVLSTAPDMDDITIPTMSITVPQWNTPDKPVVTYPADLGEAPVLDMPVVPPAPSFTLPTAPVLSDLVIPAAPEVSIPAFDISVIPEEFMDVPQGFSWEESPYNSTSTTR